MVHKNRRGGDELNRSHNRSLASNQGPLGAAMESERAPLVATTRTRGLSLMFATFCIVDLFGVFPVVALPRPIIDCGWLGIPMSLGIMGVQMYTAYLLGKCWLMAEMVDPTILNKTRYPYAAVAELCFGGTIAKLVTVILQTTIFGGGVPSLILASQMLHMVGVKVSDIDLSFCYWMLILGVVLCPIMWLGSPKDMKLVAVTSCIIVLVVSILTWTCMIQDETEVDDVTQPEPSWEAVAIAFGILAFQFDVHPLALTIQVDMDNKQKLGQAILGGFSVSGGLFLITTALARYKYGGEASRNLLQVIPSSMMLYIAIALVTLQIGLSMVVGGSALFQEVEDKLNIPSDFNWKRCVVRSGILMSAVMIGEFVPRFDLIMGLIGGALTSPLMFMFPCLFYLKLRSMLTQHQQTQRDNLLEFYYDKPPPYNPYFALKAAEQPYFHRNCAHDLDLHQGKGTEEICFEPVLPSAGADRVVECGYYGDDFMRPRRPSCGGDCVAMPPSRGPSWCEKLSCAVIILLGVLATVATTYVSLKETFRVAKLTPPCFL